MFEIFKLLNFLELKLSYVPLKLSFVNFDNDSQTTCQESSNNVTLLMDGSTSLNITCLD